MIKIILIVGWLVTTSLTFQSTWYGDSFNGNRTFNGEIFDENKMTAASNYFPIGSKLKIINKANGKSVVVRINDKGNFDRYTIDLSKGAFRRIASLKDGVIEVKIIRL